MKNMQLKRLAVFATAIGASFAAAAGSATVNTDRATFTSSLTGPVTVEDFTSTYHFPFTSGVLNSSTNEAGITPGTIKSGVTYSVVGPVTGNGFNIDAGAGYVGGFLDTVTGIGPVTVTFDQAASGFGFDTNGFSHHVHVVLNFADGMSQTYDSSLSSGDYAMHFFGFDAVGSGIVSAQIGALDNGYATFSLDDFTFDNAGLASSVPEPGSYAMLLAGVAGFAAVRRRRARAQA
jgi:hypothetical protein